ncbi:hypothetical protein BH11MYX1_BH11MYX1_19240 [soil metagenome]
MRAVLLLAAVTGCDGLFQITHLDQPVVDGAVSDRGLAPDAPVCGANDEDGDGLFDGCDPCPANAANGADDDGDGIGSACDPDPTVPDDQLAAFFAFADNAGVSSVNASFSGGAVILGDGGKLTTSQSYTQIEAVVVTTKNLDSALAIVMADAGRTVRCEVTKVACSAMTASQGCLSLTTDAGMTSSATPLDITESVVLSLAHDASNGNGVTCRLVAAGAGSPINVPGPIPDGPVTLEGASHVIVDNLSVYRKL